MKTIAIIPARYASTRFPGKPLAMLGGKPMIQWACERVSAMPELEAAIVATDDQRIYDAVMAFGGRVMMTSPNHKSGTDRCGEVLAKLESQGERYDVVINVQGDEPFVEPSQLRSLIAAFDDPQVEIASLKKAVADEATLLSPNAVKVVTANTGMALYFSRFTVPYQRGVDQQEWMRRHTYFKHVGIYAFRAEVLPQLVKLPQGELEKCESLEQLRWLENGYRIKMIETSIENVGIDTPEDLAEANKHISTIE
ncbi:MAG: 3-deoxy-manno-octulosonate cytidylyltransferase [Bacteroidales bacterium]|nr:3-deoxy-manno-octulosonate cytidylyltransferase [Bacteroidales bacterium]